jgi:23S rRNA pseudouridine1911/1915/1917 synthase
MPAGLLVLYEDEHCLAVMKPAGQFTQGSWAPPGEQTLEQAVRAHLLPEDPGAAYVGIVHRLDRPVSGVLLWARTRKAARRLSKQFEHRRVEKEYWALVEETASGAAEARGATDARSPEEGTWIDWLTPAGVAGVVRSVEAGSPGARRAETRHRVECAEGLPEGCRWLRLWPETGRTHQLRVQTALRGRPILGDAVYGARRPFPGEHAIALHARRLRVRHPISRAELEIVAPLPSSWREAGFRVALEDRGESP